MLIMPKYITAWEETETTERDVAVQLTNQLLQDAAIATINPKSHTGLSSGPPDMNHLT